MSFTDIMIAVKKGLIASKESVDNIQTTSSVTLSKAGWYRVARYVSSSTDALKSSAGNSCDLFIKRAYNNNYTEVMLLNLDSIYNNQTIKAIRVKSQLQIITKARYTIDTTNSVAYLEIYYDSNNNNDCLFEITHPKDKWSTWQAITPTLTADTVDGVTVTTTYDIPSNASPVTDLDLAVLNESIKQADGTRKLSTSILEKAVGLSRGIYEYYLAGSGYSGDDLPHASYAYGNATIFKRDTNSISVVLWTSPNSNASRLSINVYDGSSWTGWRTFATTSDLATELAKYLALDGGGEVTSNGNIQIKLKNLIGNESFISMRGVNGQLGYLGFNAENTPVFVTKDSAKTYNLLHKGNFSDYALAKDGGGTVNASQDTPIVVNNTNANGNSAYIGYKVNGEVQGYIGFSKGKAEVCCVGGGEILHKGNSTAVAVTADETTPPDINSYGLWVY